MVSNTISLCLQRPRDHFENDHQAEPVQRSSIDDAPVVRHRWVGRGVVYEDQVGRQIGKRWWWAWTMDTHLPWTPGVINFYNIINATWTPYSSNKQINQKKEWSWSSKKSVITTWLVCPIHLLKYATEWSWIGGYPNIREPLPLSVQVSCSVKGTQDKGQRAGN